ncbi:hypothetical protein BGZ49_001044 [Haplosporangium sp. Z 27]|nr:hypothetical protein BGZ49_001044 [Haplosporangium sp. Z 27]
MSSEFAEFLFSFACNKLESYPELDLRQRLLHSNLIRHILLVHQQSTSNTTDSTSSSHSSSSPSNPIVTSNPSSVPSEDQPQSLCLPPLPPSPPLSPVPQSRQQSHQYSYASPTSTFVLSSAPYQTFLETTVLGQTHSDWNPFSYDDEHDRIDSPQNNDVNLFQDLDVDMEEDPSLYLGHDDSYDTNFRFGFHPYFAEPQPQIEGGDLDYDFESSQAQEDWLDAVLEDLMEEDEQEDSSPEYDSDDDNDSFEENELNINVTRGPAAQTVVVVAHKIGREEEDILGHLLDQNGQQLIQNHHHHHYQQQQHSHQTQSSSSVPCPPLLHPCQSIEVYSSSNESLHPYQKSYLHQSFPTQEKGSAAIISTIGSKAATASVSSTATITPSATAPVLASSKGASLDEPMLPPDHVSRIKQKQMLQNPSYFKDDAYFRSCPPCLGFHSSSRPYSQKGRSKDALREQRFVQLTQELGAVLVQEQEVDPNSNLLLPEQKAFEDSFLFRSQVSPAGGQAGFIRLGH